MTWVKVCGLSRPEDVEAATQAGADAIGFVFYSGSPRLVTVDRARDLGGDFAGLKVAVTVGLAPTELLRLAQDAQVDAVQPYGAEAHAAAKAASREGLKVLFPVVVHGSPELAGLPEAAVPLLDSSELGGSGVAFDWGMAKGVGRAFVLAGGLSADNVGDAIARLRPWGVDASSGLESTPGVKDPVKLAAFVEKAKAV